MIVKRGYKCTPTCDGCSAELPPEDDYHVAVAAMKGEGWAIVRQEKLSPEWHHFCPTCKARRERHG